MSGNNQPVQQTQGAVLGFLGGASAQQSFSCEDNLSPTMRSQHGGNVPMVVYDARGNGDGKVAPTMTGDHNGHISDYTALAVHQNQVGEVRTGEVANTLNTNGNASGRNAPLVAIPIHDKATRYKGGGDTRQDDGSANGLGIGKDGDPIPTLDTASRHAVAYGIDRAAFNQGKNAQYTPQIDEELSSSLVAKGPGAVAYDCRNHTANDEVSGTIQAKSGGGYSLNYVNPVYDGFIVRRLTPTECERLMGFPDGWTEYGIEADEPKYKRSLKREQKRTGLPTEILLKKISDTQRYKALGNSVAIPCVKFVLEGVARAIGEDVR